MTRTTGIDSADHARRPWRISAIAETGSTNDDLLRAAERGELVDRSVLRVDHQTAGRGRLDRRWDAPPGSNLLASVYFAEPGDRPAEAVQRVGVSIVDALSELARTGGASGPIEPPEIGIKWPNDVLVDGQKLAGILAQRSTAALGLVVGFGVNIGWAPEGSARVADVVEIQPSGFLDAVLQRFDELPADPAAFAEMYRSRLLTLGKAVRILLPGDAIFDGIAVDVDVDGRIMVQPATGAARTFDVGDVVHLRPAGD